MNPTENDLQASVLSSATDVLESMYFTSVMGLSEVPLSGAGWIASLEFKGELSGIFTLRMTRETACLLAANFFGEEESEVAELESETAIGDMVGEMANMICGSVLSRMETETHFKLSHPAVETSSDLMQGMDRGLHQLLETDGGVLALCLLTQ
jgi:CheY-specific phosphatase CheX